MEEVYIPGVGDISRELEAEFRRGWLMEAALAEKRQREAALARRELGLEARGSLRVAIDPFWYHYWGQREGYDIWRDKKEVERFIRDTPELQLERAKSPTVGFSGCDAPVLEGRPVSSDERMLVAM